MSAHSHTDHLPAELEKATLEGRNKILGFWLFLGAECALFGTLFASYLALRGNNMGGPTANELFDLSIVALATFILLTSSLFSVLAVHEMHRHNLGKVRFWLAATVLFGLAFLALEIYEFVHYVHEGHTFSSSAFASSFYSLVGFHGSHVLFGVCWIALLVAQLGRKGLTVVTGPKIYVAALYWHFIDVVWVFIFTVVYLMGKVG